jgi:hypothetical protein
MWLFGKKRDDAQNGPGKIAAEEDPAVKYDLVQSLREAADAGGLKPHELFLSILFDPARRSRVGDRCDVLLGDGKRLVQWRVESLRPLFRGSLQPPPDAEMAQYPEQYVPFFHRVEYNVYRYCRTMELVPSDSEFLELYSQMRRRPDGRSLGPLHDVIWQSAALVLGLLPWSEAEYSAVFGQLARSARHFKLSLSSRNYIACVRQTIGREP